MKKSILLLLLVSNYIFSQNLKTPFQLIPYPQSIEYKNSRGIKAAELQYILSKTAKMPVLPEVLNRLPQCNGNTIGVELEITNIGTPKNQEGYTLEVAESGVIIKARTEAGLFYGCQTLAQLMEDSQDFDVEIPAMIITDYPDINYRAIHLDTKHHLDRVEYYYRMMDKLARYKINAVIWEIEDKLRFSRRPEIGSPNAISKQEVQALCRYAKERQIDISPLVQGLGHAAFILKHHPELRENPQSDWEFCPSEPKTYEMQFDLYADALEAMPYGKYLHVGGDEISAIGIDDRCKATGKSAFELQMDWLNKVCNYAVTNGRIPIVWDDMPLKYAGLWDFVISKDTEEELEKKWNPIKMNEAISLFPKECIYMRWNYENATLPAHKKIVQWYTDKELKMMGATAASAGDSPFLPREEKTGYIKGFCQLIADNNLLGILATAWDDGSPHLETVWRGYIALGEFGWNSSARTVEEFKKAHGQREFGFRPEENQLCFVDELEQAAYFFDDALIISGRRNPAWGVKDFVLMDLPDKNMHGSWSKKYADKLERAYIEQQRYNKIVKGVLEAKKRAIRNRYTLEIYEQTNHLINYPTRLLLALQQYDSANSELERENSLENIKNIVNYFYEMRNNLETVYSKTRFMENPEGYLMDMNQHNHLSAKSNNSDWLYLHELPMVEKVKEWVKEQ